MQDFEDHPWFDKKPDLVYVSIIAISRSKTRTNVDLVLIIIRMGNPGMPCMKQLCLNDVTGNHQP